MKNVFARKRFPRGLIRGTTRVLHHILVVVLSAAFALSLPYSLRFVAKNFLAYWSLIGNEKIFLVSLEVVLAILLIFLSNYISRSWKDRRISNMARGAGLVFVSPAKGLLTGRKARRLKEEQGLARDVMVIGSTGLRTFVDPQGDLHQVIQNCREAKVMLLHPFSEGAASRAKSILDPNLTPEVFGEQIRKSIEFLKGLKAVQKNVRLKLYGDTPLLKMTILGDYLWIQHYHVGLDIQFMPEYVFKHDQNARSLYTPFYQYFVTRWNRIDIPEYDLDTDELVYRDAAANEIRRMKFSESESEMASDTDSASSWIPGNLHAPGGDFNPSMRNRRDHVCIEDLFKNVW